jgi:hypothetical protein
MVNLNADLSRRAAMHGAKLYWATSPIEGVERRMLDRIGGEVARATSIVRYAPKSRFSSHVHGGGEEFFVLSGVFQDERGDFIAGTYVRNSPQSQHTPGSEGGCVILVKLWQFDLDDRTPVRIDTSGRVSLPAADRPGVSTMPLFRDAREDVRLKTWAPGVAVSLDAPRGLELFILDGSFSEGGETFAGRSWLRMPAESRLSAAAGPEGCRVWAKSGHLMATR